MRYEKLFETGKIGSLRLKNRIVMPAMGTGFATSSGEASDEIIRYYEERARGGCGLIITEITRIDDETGVGMSCQLSATKGMHIQRLERLADAVHRHDTKIFAQLHHPGRQTPSKLLGGKPPVAPSPFCARPWSADICSKIAATASPARCSSHRLYPVKKRAAANSSSPPNMNTVPERRFRLLSCFLYIRILLSSAPGPSGKKQRYSTAG